MFGTQRNRAAAYTQVGIETGVSTASPHQLIVMLYDGALLAITTANTAMADKNIPVKGASISKAIEIIDSGLKVSLDMEAGGQLSQRLAALYDYMTERLLYANIENSPSALEEVSGLLSSLREAWLAIAPNATHDAKTEQAL